MLIIGVAGGTGSGKSTLAKNIIRKLGSEQMVLISQDSYYKNFPELTYEKRCKINYDHPDSFDSDLLVAHLKQLKQGQSIQVPEYDFVHHQRTARTHLINPQPLIIVEGLLILALEEIRAELDLKIFVDTDPDERILRRILRDIEERGRTLESVISQYLLTVKPMHDAFVEPSKRYADLIIPNGGHNDKAINLLSSDLEKYLVKDTLNKTPL